MKNENYSTENVFFCKKKDLYVHLICVFHVVMKECFGIGKWKRVSLLIIINNNYIFHHIAM